MRKGANNYQIQHQEQQQMEEQPLQSHPSGIYHNGTWYSPLGYESQPYTGSLPLPYNQSPQSFQDCAYSYHVESGNAQPYSFESDNLAQLSSSGRSSASAQDEQQQQQQQQQQQEQQIYYYQTYDYQQPQQVYQVPQQVPQYQVVPPAAAPPPQQQQYYQQPIHQSTQQSTQRICQPPTQQTPQRAPQQMHTFQRYRDEQTLTARPESKALGSNVIEIDLTDSCDVYISRAPSKLVINIATPRVQDRYEAPNYVIRPPTDNMQNQSENYERFEHESEFSFAGDTDESYNEEYSNSEESQYLPEQWEESPTYFLKPNLLTQQDFVPQLQGHCSGDRKPPKQMFHEHEYDQFRAPRRVVHHNHQPIYISSLNMVPNVCHEQQNVTILNETDVIHETPSCYILNNQEEIAMERVEVEKIVPRSLEALPQAVPIDADIVAPISDERNTPIIGVCLPQAVAPQHEQQTLVISNDLVLDANSSSNFTKCEQEPLENIYENAENLEHNTESSNVLSEDLKTIEFEPISNVVEKLEVLNVIEIPQKTASLNNIESELGISVFKETPCAIKTETTGKLRKTNLKSVKSKKKVAKCETVGSKDSLNVVQISKEDKAKLSEDVNKEATSLAQPDIDIHYKAQSEKVIEPICYKILNMTSPEVDQLVVPSTSDEENITIGNTSKLRQVQSSESDLCKQSKVIPETIDNVATKTNGSKLAGHSNAERTEKIPLDVVPKKSPKNSPKGKKAEACQIKSEKVTEPTCHKIQNISTLEVEQPVATADVAKIVSKSNAKRKKNKKNNLMDSIPVESEPVQPFGGQQANSVKKGANKLSKLERKALRQVKESQKELQSKEQAKLSEIPQEEEQEQEQEQEQQLAESESVIAQADEPEPLQAATNEDSEHSVLKNISDAHLRRTLMRIIDKINYL